MPKKLNSAGNMQNYVPAGNGDASGEYGDNNSGSNIHYTASEGGKTDKTENPKQDGKAKDVKKDGVSVQIKQEDGKIDYKGKDYTDEKEITSIIMQKMGASKQTENVKRVVAQLYSENIDPAIRNVVLSTLESRNYKIEAKKNGAGKFLPSADIIWFSSTDQLGSPTGETMFHECGHALDHQYNNGLGIWSKDYKSKEFGKSMIAMKDEELGNALRNGGYKKLVAEYNEFKQKNDEQIKKINDEISSIDKQIKELEKLPDDLQKTMSKLEDDIKAERLLFYDNKISWVEYNENLKGLYDKMESVRASYNNPNVSKIEKLREKMNPLYDKKNALHQEAHYSAVAKYSDISDMCEAMGYRAFAGGHGRRYWKNASHEATECFAEIQSAIGTNKESFEVLQKYIPSTIKIYKEIIGEIYNGKK